MKGHFQREGVLMIAFPVTLMIAGLLITIVVQALRGAGAFR